MGEVVNVLVAIAVVVFVVRWATSSKDTPQEKSASSVLGFRPKNVTDGMVETVHSMFPDIPNDNIRYDLLRTGSIEITTNKLLERGFLPPPPEAYYTLYPRTQPPAARPAQQQQQQPVAGSSKSKPTPTLIDRYNLKDRVGVDTGASEAPEDIAAKSSTWEDDPKKREATLRERKAQMVLAARQRLLAQQQKAEGSS
ncbi:hypothetical protein QCA50_007359 [Cerrena zonata]|uniref:CUE domain-containing protein n=1 Tax=Cerrena zonata TaxID=2478898 RepID=A0AAW0GDE8_9APHY